MMTKVTDDIMNHIGEHDIILVGTNLYASMANGFQLDVSLNYPYVYEMNKATGYGDMNKLGTILECSSEGEPTFVLCFITKGYNFRPDIQKDYLSYEALERCLRLVDARYQGMNIGSPILGIGRFDGNGESEKVMELFSSCTGKADITLYDFKDLSRKEKMMETYRKEAALKESDREAYYKAVAERKRLAEERFRKNGRRRY